MALSIAGPDAQPLLRSRSLRSLTAFAVLVGGLLVVLLAIVIALFEGSWPLLSGSVLVGYGVCAAAAVIDRGWRPGRSGRVEQGGVVVVALACLFVAGSAALDAGQTLRQLPTLGTAPHHAAFSLALLAVALFALALLVAVLPLGSGRTRTLFGRVTAGTAVLALLAGGASAFAASAPADTGCGRFDFQPSRWQAALSARTGEDANRMAEAVERCGVVAPGATRAAALALLGRPGHTSDGLWH